MDPGLHLPASTVDRLVAWARASRVEVCGLLVGRTTAAGDTEVVRAVAARNTAADPRERYEVDPADHLAAWEAARAEGLELVGAWHSHPRSAAVPSETDRAAAWPGWSYVIVGTDGVRAWRLEGDAFREEAVLAVAGGAV